MSASIGLVMAPDEGDCYMELYQKADHALYQAKKRGKNQCVIISREMNVKQAEESLRNLLKLKFTILCPAHGEPEKRKNVRWEEKAI